MSHLEVELGELEERLARLRALAGRNAAPPPKQPVSLLPEKWDGHATFSVEETAEILGSSTWVLYELIKRGELDAIRLGRLIRIGRPTLEKMLGGGEK